MRGSFSLCDRAIIRYLSRGLGLGSRVRVRAYGSVYL